MSLGLLMRKISTGNPTHTFIAATVAVQEQMGMNVNSALNTRPGLAFGLGLIKTKASTLLYTLHSPTHVNNQSTNPILL
jgi:hypothetical protein